jgi:DNA-binding GntR family transcriptional regulator
VEGAFVEALCPAIALEFAVSPAQVSFGNYQVANTVEEKRSAPDFVRDQLRQAIHEGKFRPGDQLRQEELADRFGISRIPVREALRQLEAEGLVTLHPNRGAVVATLSLQEVLEMLDIRIALECRAICLAVPNMIESDFDAATQILKSYDKEPMPQRWGEMNWRFHEALYAPCNRPKLLTMIEANYGHVSRFVRTQVSMASGKEKPQKDHNDILESCRAGDARKAASLLEQHIARTQKSLMAASRSARKPTR